MKKIERGSVSPGRRIFMTNIIRILVLAIMLVMPSAAGRMPAADIRLEEISTIGGPEADLLYLWTSIAVDKDGNVYCTDALV